MKKYVKPNAELAKICNNELIASLNDWLTNTAQLDAQYITTYMYAS